MKLIHLLDKLQCAIRAFAILHCFLIKMSNILIQCESLDNTFELEISHIIVLVEFSTIVF